MKTETKIILGMMAGSKAFTLIHETFEGGEKELNIGRDYSFWTNEIINGAITIQARKSIKPLFSFNYLLSLLSSGILPEVIAEKLEQDGIKIEWV